MKQRIVTSRVPISAHATQTYRFLENLENHRQLLPRATGWSADKDSARYSFRVGFSRINVEMKVVERVAGGRVGVESCGGSSFPFRRWYKVQADEHACIAEMSMECEISAWQRIFLAPGLKGQMEAMLARLKAIMEQPAASP